MVLIRGLCANLNHCFRTSQCQTMQDSPRSDADSHRSRAMRARWNCDNCLGATCRKPISFPKTASSLGLFQAKSYPGNRTSRLAATETLNRAQAVPAAKPHGFSAAPRWSVQQSPAGTSPFTSQALSWAAGIKRAGRRNSVRKPDGLSKFSTCTFVGAERPLRFISILFTCVVERSYSSHTILTSWATFKSWVSEVHVQPCAR